MDDTYELRTAGMSEDAAKRFAAECGWQPIETAPKDGEFLAYDSATKKMDVCHMKDLGRDRWACWPVQFDGEYGPGEDEFGYGPADDITHWMPLPSPPKA